VITGMLRAELSPALAHAHPGRALLRLTAMTAAALTACSLLAAPAGASLRGSGPAGSTTTSAFTAVSCPAADDCWAVGSVSNNAQAEIYRWNGSTWTQFPLKPPAQGSSTSLDSVSCASVSLCWAVGLLNAGGELKAYALRWNGTRWSAGGANLLAYPTAAFCASTTDCWVAGAAAIEHWNGGRWAQVATPAPLVSPEAPALYCVSRSDCWLTGAKPGLTGTVTGHWKGSAWLSRGTPLKHRNDSYLSGLSCLGAKACLTVSANINADPTDAMSWNGSAWVRVAGPAGELGAVSCTAGLGCMAVGDGLANDLEAYGELWTGSQWQVVSNQPPPGVQSQLAGVSCVSASDCWAVGSQYDQAHTVITNLIEHWNGMGWSVFS
jgi:hypothetical protein